MSELGRPPRLGSWKSARVSRALEIPTLMPGGTEGADGR